MKKLLFLSLFILALVVSYNCKKSEMVRKTPELNLPATAYDYSTITTIVGSDPVLYEDGSTVDNGKATIGRVLFYDKALSLNNSVSCASCHKQENAFADTKALSIGFEESKTLRNSIGIGNLRDELVSGYFWDGRERTIESMVFAPIANHIEMGFERTDLIVEKLSHLSYYKPLFQKYYGSDVITEERVRESLGNFLFSIVSSNSKFNLHELTGSSDFSAAEVNGLRIFSERKCNTCHLISDNFQTSYGNGGITFANNGLAIKDMDDGISGNFKIPRLRNISKTAPYMHDGSIKTLEEVIDHYSNGIQNNPNLSFLLRNNDGTPMKFNFDAQEKHDLIAFLKTLDDEVLASDVKFSSPFK